MQIITDLSPAARACLITFCRENLKSAYDAAVYADWLIDEADFSHGAHFEIRGFYTTTGNPVTLNMGNAPENFLWSDHPEADDA